MEKENLKPKNACFIDGQNFYYSFIKQQNRQIDWKRFRIYLKEKYNVVDAFYFIGFFDDNIRLYTELQKAGFVLVFKPITIQDGEMKGNVDGDLIAFASRVSKEYDGSSFVTNDGDYHRLVEFLKEDQKLQFVFVLNKRFSSWLLRKKAGGNIVYLQEAMHLFSSLKVST